jgi:hypothetical protein
LATTGARRRVAVAWLLVDGTFAARFTRDLAQSWLRTGMHTNTKTLIRTATRLLGGLTIVAVVFLGSPGATRADGTVDALPAGKREHTPFYYKPTTAPSTAAAATVVARSTPPTT